jgi:hypothetical protein
MPDDGGFDPDIVRASDWSPEIIPPVDPDTGLSAGFATATGSVMGISISTICGWLAGAFVLVLFVALLAPIFIKVPPSQVGHPGSSINAAGDAVDAINDPFSKDSVGQPLKAATTNADSGDPPILVHDPSYPTISEHAPNDGVIVHDPNFPLPKNPSDVIASTDPEWEQTLQKQRMEADPSEWPALIQKHLEVYKQLGVNPCTSGFFPQGCSQ